MMEHYAGIKNVYDAISSIQQETIERTKHYVPNHVKTKITRDYI